MGHSDGESFGGPGESFARGTTPEGAAGGEEELEDHSLLWEEIFSKYPRKCYGTFLDVGAFDGKTLSNSKFYEETLGWHGVSSFQLRNSLPQICIEAGTNNFNQLIHNRPQCINLFCAAYSTSGEVLHFTDDSTGGQYELCCFIFLL